MGGGGDAVTASGSGIGSGSALTARVGPPSRGAAAAVEALLVGVAAARVAAAVPGGTPQSLTAALWPAIESSQSAAFGALGRGAGNTAATTEAQAQAQNAGLSALRALRFFLETVASEGGGLGAGETPTAAREVLVLVRTLLLRLCWTDSRDVPLPRRAPAAVALTVAALGAFNALYDRFRRGGGGSSPAFAIEADFLLPGIPVAELTAPVVLGFAAAVEVADEGDADAMDERESGGGGGGGGGLVGDGGVASAAAATAAAASQFSTSARLRAARVMTVLTCMPQAVPFNTRVRLFNALREAEQDRVRPRGHAGLHRVRLRVRRAHLVDDAFRAFEKIAVKNPNDLQQHFFIEFVNTEVSKV